MNNRLSKVNNREQIIMQEENIQSGKKLYKKYCKKQENINKCVIILGGELQ